MWWWKCACCVVFLTLHLASGEYSCYIGGRNLSCTALAKDNLHENISVLLGNENSNTIEELKILDSSLFTIKREMFANFKNLQRLYLQSTKINYLDDDAFADLTNLKELYLTDNYLGAINSNILPVQTLQTLDLSQNLLKDLSDFDINAFPSLTILNISHNRLEYLPENIVNKLKEESKLYLIIDNNPWNCDHADWNQHLTTILTDAFCTNNAYDPGATEKKLETLATGYLVQESEGGLETCHTKCAMQHCLLWMIGAVWIGIILGNVCKIKRLLFTTPKRYDDKTTQCDKLDLISKV